MFPKYSTIDTLKMAKNGFYFNSNKLDHIAQYLGVGKKTEHAGLDMWKKTFIDNCQDSLNQMVEYCKNDVVILENVYHKLSKHSYPKFNYATLNGESNFCCPNCGSYDVKLRKTYTTSMGVLRRSMKCEVNCNTTFVISNKTYEKFIMYKLSNGIL